MGTVFIRGRYYSRVIIPADLRPLIGRVEIRKSLGTVYYRDAKLLANKWEGKLADLFTRLRQHGDSMTVEQIKKLVQSYIDSALEESEQSWLNGKGLGDEEDAYSMAITGRLEETAEQLQRNDLRGVSEEADGLLKTQRRTLPKSSEGYRRLCRELLKANQFLLKRELDRLDGIYLNEFGQGSTREALPQPETIRLISEVLPDYFKHYSHRGDKTNREKAQVLRRFVESVGDKPVHEITKADCVQFRDLYSRMPKRVSNESRKASIRDILKPLKGNYTAVSKGTVNYALIDVSHLFSWCIKNDLYPGRNPVDGIAYEGTKPNRYDTFTDGDLTAMFTAKAFLEEKTGRHPERYWLILVLAFTGARREEGAQLRVDDIKQAEGVWHFHITDTDGKKVKNVHSRRRVPVHSRLLELGFLDYLAMRRRAGPLLFPIPPKTKGRKTVGDAVNKWLSRLRLTLGIESNKPLHSFRHSMVTRLISAGVPQDMREVILGHASASVHGSVYTHREEISLTLLQSHLEKLKLPV